MTIEKLDEFASNGDKHLTGLDVATGFPRADKPERPWFNKLFGDITGKINEVVDNIDELPPFEGGVLADTFVTVEEQITGEGALSLRDFNSRAVLTVNSMAELLQVKATAGRTVFVKGLHGGTFIYDSSKSAINDGGLIFNGWVRDTRDKIVTPEMFGAKPNDDAFDNTTALNAAFATGFDIQGDINSTYHVSGIINSKGQKCLGGWNIHSSRSDGSVSGKLGLVKTTTEGVDSLSVRMLYVESAYDLTELLIIKSLGFNTLNHYGYFGANSSDGAGTVQQLLDNCLSAGLQVNLGTESDIARADLSAFINSTQDHPALWGYSVYDEPATRGISIVDQDAKITTMRGITSKPLSFVDLLVSGNAFNQMFSVNYDTVFVDSYSMHYSTGTADEWLKKDLAKMRLDFGGIKAMTKISKIYPVISAFTANSFYSANQAQIIRASTIFGKIAEGNFGAFVWDGNGDPSITDNVRKNTNYRKLCSELCEQKVRKKTHTDAYIFGSTPDDTDWGLADVLSNLAVADPYSADPSMYNNAYPMKLVNGAVENDRTSTTLPNGFSGIGMKGAYSATGMRIKARGNVTAVLEFFRLNDQGLDGNFELLATKDNGYSGFLAYADSTGTGNKTMSITTTDLDKESSLVFKVTTPGDTSTTYRKFLRGLIVCSDW